MCPDDILSNRRTALSSYRRKLCVVSYPFPVEDPIVFKTRLGRVIDEKLVGTLSGRDKVAQSRASVPKIKFLREKPPVPYTAWHVWVAMWSYSSPSAINQDFSVKYSALLKDCRLFYPPWLSKESDQITQGRLRDALELLAFIGWVEFSEPISQETAILVHYSKGDRIRSETFDFLTKKFVELTFGHAKKSSLGRGRRIPSARTLRVKPSGKNERLDSFIK
jgi:hypothetical protein